MIYAAMFNSDDEPVLFMTGTPDNLNLNIPAGGTWREIPEDIEFIEDVPPLAELAAHPECEEPA